MHRSQEEFRTLPVQDLRCVAVRGAYVALPAHALRCLRARCMGVRCATGACIALLAHALRCLRMRCRASARSALPAYALPAHALRCQRALYVACACVASRKVRCAACACVVLPARALRCLPVRCDVYTYAVLLGRPLWISLKPACADRGARRASRKPTHSQKLEGSRASRFCTP